MPVLTIKGVPNTTNVHALEDLIEELAASVGRTLGISYSEISIFLPADLVQHCLGEELVCDVDGLFQKPERTPDVRKETFDAIALALGVFAKEHLPQCRKVEVIPARYDQDEDGFATLDPRTL